MSPDSIPDPELTGKGIEQCKELRTAFPYDISKCHFVCSPLQRALQTCIVAFNPVETTGWKIHALPELLEINHEPSNALFGKHLEFSEHVSFSHMGGIGSYEHYFRALPLYDPDVDSVVRRAGAVCKWLSYFVRGLAPEEEHHVVVVSHAHFLSYLAEDLGHFAGRRWGRGERREFYLREDEDGWDFRLVEVRATDAAGGEEEVLKCRT